MTHDLKSSSRTMSRTHRSGFALSLLALSLALGCGEAGCGDVLTPLEEPLPAYKFFDDGAVARVSPSGVTFLENNLSRIVGDLASSECSAVNCPGGWAACDAEGICRGNDPERAFIGVKIPPSTEVSPATGISNLHICRDDFNGSNGGDPDHNAEFNDCSLYVRVDNVSLSPDGAGGEVGVAADITVWSSEIRTRVDTLIDFQCDIFVRDADNIDNPIYKTVETNVSFNTDNPLGRLEVAVETPAIDLLEDDVHLCGLLNSNLLKGFVFGFLEENINNQIETFMTDAIEGLLTESCAEAPCTRPDISACFTDDTCRFDSDGSNVPRFLGFEGNLALSSLLGGFAGDASSLDFSIQGNRGEGTGTAIVVGMKAAVQSERSDCVPSAPAPEATTEAFFPAVFGDHLVIAASDELLNTMMYEAYRSGTLCQSIRGTAVPQLKSGLLSTIVTPSLAEVALESAPMIIDLRPQTPPRVEVGKNVVAPNPENPDEDILLEPLLNLVMNDLELDIYVDVEGAMVRILTISADLVIDLSLAVGGNGELVLVAGDASNWLENADIIDTTILREDPMALEESIPTLLGIALPFLTDSLEQSFALPGLAGFEIELNDLTGSQNIGTTTRGDERFAYMGIYADLAYSGAQALTPVAETFATMTTLHVPEAADIRDGDKVRVAFDVSTIPSTVSAPVVWVRVDDGIWRIPQHRDHVVITDPVLHAEGEHIIEIKAALAGAPHTLDPEAEVFTIVVDAHAPALTLAPVEGGVDITVSDSVSTAADLTLHARLDGGTAQTIALSAEGTGHLDVDLAWHEVEITVTDASGRTATETLGQNRALTKLEAPRDNGRIVDLGDRSGADAPASVAAVSSCSAHTVPEGVPYAALLVLLVGATRPRRRRRG